MAELVDALVSGTSDRKVVQVRFLFWAPIKARLMPGFCVLEGEWIDFANDLVQLKGQERVWVLFSHYQLGKDHARKEFILYQLDEMGTRIDLSCLAMIAWDMG